jgi:hypothetical protein
MVHSKTVPGARLYSPVTQARIEVKWTTQSRGQTSARRMEWVVETEYGICHYVIEMGYGIYVNSKGWSSITQKGCRSETKCEMRYGMQGMPNGNGSQVNHSKRVKSTHKPKTKRESKVLQEANALKKTKRNVQNQKKCKDIQKDYFSSSPFIFPNVQLVVSPMP